MNCMCSIYQKFYSSLKNLDSISINNDFFDNISCFDSFFNEFRSITFTLQNNFRHNNIAMEQFESLKNKYLMSNIMKWCNLTRVDVTHKNPFQLNKIIDIELYYMDKARTKIHHSCNLAINDMSFKEISDEIIRELSNIQSNEPELYFTINYSFLDAKENINIFDNISEILSNMNNFILEFDKSVKYECNNCEVAKNKIVDLLNRVMVKNIEFQKDGIFDIKNKTIKFGNEAILAFANHDNVIIKNTRVSTKENSILKGKTYEEMFLSFIYNHILLFMYQQKHIMPTFFIFFNDDTFTINSFLFDIKSTIYKKINEIANNISKDKITAVFLVCEMYGYNNFNKDIEEKAYEERILNSDTEFLSFSMITSDLREKHYLIDTNDIIDEKSVINIISNLKNYEVICLLTSLIPIKRAFDKENKESIH